MSDLTLDEQEHVRHALRFIHKQCGEWAVVAKAIKIRKKTLAGLMSRDNVSVRVAFAVSRLLKISLDDLLAGNFTPATCPHCGQATPVDVSSTVDISPSKATVSS